MVLAATVLVMAIYLLAEREMETIFIDSQKNKCEALNELGYETLIERAWWTAAVGFPASLCREQLMKIYPNANATFCVVIAAAALVMAVYHLAEREMETIFISN